MALEDIVFWGRHDPTPDQEILAAHLGFRLVKKNKNLPANGEGQLREVVNWIFKNGMTKGYVTGIFKVQTRMALLCKGAIVVYFEPTSRDREAENPQASEWKRMWVGQVGSDPMCYEVTNGVVTRKE